ncbi:MAG: APC family permease [Mycoplasmatales bacterium]|nr:APC family permease [Mycoplasmatales bacterium]
MATKTKNNAKKIGFLSVIITVIGSAIGAGIFFKNNSILNNTHGNMGLAISSWAVAAIGILAIGLALIEVASTQEKDKGILGWAQKFTKISVFKWSKGYMLLLFFPITFVTIPLYAVMALQDATGWTMDWWAVTLIAFAIFLWISLISFWNLKASTKLQWVFTILKFLPIILIPIFGFINVEHNHPTADSPVKGLTGMSPYLGVVASVPAIFFAYDGFYTVSSIKEEMAKPKLLPLALAIGIGAITSMYLLITSGVLVGSKHGGANVFNNETFKVIMNSCIFMAVLGIVNGFAMGSYNVYDDYIEEDNFIFSNYFKKWKTKDIKITKKVSLRGFTPGFIILVILTIIFFIISAVVGAYAYKTIPNYVASYKYTKTAALYNFVDLLTNWSSLLVFGVIVLSIVGALINRKTNKVKVEKSKLFIPSAIIAILFTAIPVIYMLVASIVDMTGFNHADKISSITTFCVLLGTLTLSFIPWIFEVIYFKIKTKKEISESIN